MRRLFLLFLFFWIQKHDLFSQVTNVQYTFRIDSVQKLVENHVNDDITKAKQLVLLGQLYICNDQLLKGLITTKQACELYEKMNDPAGRGYFLQAMTLLSRNSSLVSNERISVFYVMANWYMKKIKLKDSFSVFTESYYYQVKNVDSRLKELLIAIDHFLKEDDKEMVANLQLAAGIILKEKNRTDECIDLIDQSIAIFKQLGQPEVAFVALLVKLQALAKTTQAEKAKELEILAIKQIISTSDIREKSLLCIAMFSYYYDSNKEGQALEYLLKAVNGFKEFQDKQTLIRLYDIAGDEIQIYGSPKKAFIFLQNELKLRKELNDNDGIAYTYITTAFCLIKLDKYEEALKYIALTQQLAAKSNDEYYFAKCSDAKGQVLMGQKKFREAIVEFSNAAAIFKKHNKTWAESYQYGYISACYFKENEFAQSIRYGHQSLEIGKNGNYIPVMLMSTKSLSDAYARLGKSEKSYEYLKLYSDTKDSLLQSGIDNRLADLETQSLTEDAMREKEKMEAEKQVKDDENRKQRIWLIGAAACLIIVLSFAFTLNRNNNSRKKANKLLNEQKLQVEHAFAHLKSTQSQLIQSEKMASLGELTAGIAHEIQNPLNFVNNFSEVSNELIDEMNAEIEKGDLEEAKAIASDIKQNLEKINHHGKRADAIVKGMLQHSRSSSGIKEPTDINALCDEYLRLSYHGLRAKDKSFNAILKTDYDETIGNINIIPQDIGRVILNLITNAFYAVDEKKKKGIPGYEPTVSVSTKHSLSGGEGRGEVIIKVTDNGNGIPQNIIDKIFQPFFTTKPTGQGTGLGLSLSYDIVKAHGGELKVETKVEEGNPDHFGKGEGTTFIILLPLKENLV